MTDPIIQTKTCRHCQKSFDITQGDLDFYDKISRGLPGYQESPHGERKDLSGVDKLGVRIPTPTLCPECRQRRRLSFRNERKLYRRKCDASGKDIISIYSPDKPFRVYDQKIRRSDERDPMSYGRDFDFTRSFTEQFGELMKEVPRWGLINTNSNSNSSYTNFTDSSENIYMCSDVYQCKDVLYAHTIKNIQNSIDLLDVTNSQESYYCSFSSDLYNCKFVVFSKNCSTSSYLSYCVNLQQSAYCVGLENQSYCILNRPYSRNEYYHILDTMSHDKLFYDYSLLLEQYSKPLRLINCENAQGNNLANCKNCKEVYFAQSVTNSRYIYIGYNMDQCMDTTIHNIDCYLDYEACSGGKLKYCGFNMLGRGGEYIFYTQECIN
ncbi:MAG TPA: hypothetical protein PLW93_04295, partial [Candidatus Absconditabacterales bacterium]|nr:hypothetical protein [Candidatus Absconditabacterales bacterium]